MNTPSTSAAVATALFAATDSYTRLHTNNLMQYVKLDSPRLASKVSTYPWNSKHSASKQAVVT
jgi:hypothetical protein